MQIQPTEPVSPADPFSQQDLNLYTECDFLNSADQALPKELVDAFAEATGWELGWIGEEIKIIDMSATWPAKTPTAHRGHCDRVAQALSKLILR